MGYAGGLVAPRSTIWHVATVATVLSLVTVSSSVARDVAEQIQGGDISLYLETHVNGRPKHLIAEFVQEADGRFRSRASELRDIGINPGSASGEDEWVYLDNLPDVDFTYDKSLQTIEFELKPASMATSNFDLRGPLDTVPLSKPSFGAMLDYSASGQFANDTSSWEPSFNGASLLLDSHLFSPLGSINQSGLISARSQSGAVEFRRLDTAWSVSDPATRRRYILGDLITGGASWARPIRMGGFSIRRNFATRPDLITRPLPAFEGTAQVPSTVDVFLGDRRLSSVDVDTGPFTLENIPVPSQAGELRFVVRDATGMEKEETLSFAGDQLQLREGLFDFSLDAGFARTGYGTNSDRYGSDLISASGLRYGLSDRLTVEAQTEIGAGLINAGAGASLGVPGLGVVRVAVAGSVFEELRGTLVSAGYSYAGDQFNVNAETRRIFGRYRDLADITMVDRFASHNIDRIVALDRFHLKTRLSFSKASFGVGYTHSENKNGEHRNIVNASIGYEFNRNARVWLDGFSEVGSGRRFGIHAGMTVALSGNRNLSYGGGYSADGYYLESTISRSANQDAGSWGYSASVGKKDDSASLEARVLRYGEVARAGGHIRTSENSIAFNGSMEGSVAVLDGEVQLLNRIEDSFVVVDAGAPDVRVYRENRLVGKTGQNGKLFIGGVRSFEANKISIEPNDLPLESSISKTELRMSLPENSGTVVRFSKPGSNRQSNVIVFVDDAGAYIPAGSTGRHLGSGTEFVIGYDGEAMIDDLQATNQVEIDIGLSVCVASFDLAKNDNTLVAPPTATCETR